MLLNFIYLLFNYFFLIFSNFAFYFINIASNYSGYPLYKNLPFCDSFSEKDALVMCRTLGLTETISAKVIFVTDAPEQYKKSRVKSVKCTGHEDHIRYCSIEDAEEEFECNNVPIIICKDPSSFSLKRYENSPFSVPLLMDTQIAVLLNSDGNNLGNTARLVCNKYHNTTFEGSTLIRIKKGPFDLNKNLCLIGNCLSTHLNLEECVEPHYRCSSFITENDKDKYIFIMVGCQKCSPKELISILDDAIQNNNDAVQNAYQKFEKKCNETDGVTNLLNKEISLFLEDVKLQQTVQKGKTIVINTEVDVFQMLKDVSIQKEFRDLHKKIENVSDKLAKKLGYYFGELAYYDNQIAFADIAYSYQVWYSAKAALAQKTLVLKNHLEVIFEAAFLAAKFDMASNLAQTLLSYLSILNPISLITEAADPINAAIDKLNAYAKSVRNIQTLVEVGESLDKLASLGENVHMKVKKNLNLFQLTDNLIKKAGTKNTFTYKDAKDFLKYYNDFEPALTNEDIEKYNEYLSQIIEKCCSMIEDPETIAGAITTVAAAANANCPKAKLSFASIKAFYLDIATQQFALMDSFSRAARSKIAEINANKLKASFNQNSNHNVIMKKIDTYKAIFFHRTHTISLISEACNYLTYMYFGEEPDICKTLRKNPDGDLTILSNYKIRSMCSSEISDSITRVVRIPAKSISKSNDAIGLFDLFNVGEHGGTKGTTYFRIPDKKWLVENGWLEEYEGEGPFFLQSLNIYMPTYLSTKKQRIQLKITALEIELNSKSYLLNSKGTEFVNRYSYNDNCNEMPINDPYKIACNNKSEKICFETSGNHMFSERADLLPKLENTLWKLSLESKEKLTSLFPADTTYLYGSVKLCFKKTINEKRARRRSVAPQTRECCETGKWYNSQQETCEDCTVGAARLYDFYCEDCPAGYETNSGLFGCKPCDINHFKEKRGPGECIRCSSGEVAPVTGSTICQPVLKIKKAV